MIVEKLKSSDGYEFECNMDKSYRDYKEHDEWGCAFVWLNDFGVEYNFCMQGEQANCCAIYKMDINKNTGYMETDTSTYEHYEIDFEKDNWKAELEDAMCKALIRFFELDKSMDRKFEVRRADMENIQEYRIWKHVNQDIWEKCGDNFGVGSDVLVLVDVKDVCEFDYKGEHFTVFGTSLDKNQFCKDEFYEPIGKTAKVVYYRFTEKDFVNVAMRADTGKTKKECNMNKKDFLQMCLNEKNKLPMEGIKAWEFAIQQAVEKMCPGELWYDITKVSIFKELLSGKMPVDVCEMVWNDVAQELSSRKSQTAATDKTGSLGQKINNAEGKRSSVQEKIAITQER